MRINTLLLIGIVFLFNIISIRAQIVIGEQKERPGISELYELEVDVDEIAQILGDAPPLISEENGVLLRLPLADGSFHTFEMFEAALMQEGLARKYNSVRSYKGWDVQHPERVVRLNTGPLGMFAFIADHEDQSIIQPLVGEESKHELYFSRNTFSNWTCGVDHEEIGGKENSDQPESTNNCTVNGTDYYTYIVVVSTTGEFYDLNGGTMSSALNALVNRLAATVIPYERDLAMTFVLSDSNDIVMYTDSLTDPYPNPTDRGESINIVDTVIQNHFDNADYDIGHGYHEFTCGGPCGWGGLAGVAVACVNGSKARAWTYQPNDIATNTVWSHEFGHQLSCWHTNYGCNNTGCHRYEPGRGVTIMSTSANCSGDDFYANRVDFFHAKSIEAILEFTNNGNLNNPNSSCNLVSVGGWSSCVQTTSSGNTPPTVTANPNNLNLTIPVNTPFRLDGTATDPEGNAMTYTWVDYNTDPNNTADPDNTANSTTAPLFRWFSPSTDTFRYFPMLTSILNGNTTTGTGEILPAVGRSMDFRFLARDNASPYGAIACDEITVTVDGGSGPFEITAPNTAVSWTAGNTESIIWNVNNTDQSPINATSVDILLSTDGGQNFNITLASNTANDGTESITVPSVTTTTARIKVQPSGDYIFFDINDVDFSIDDPSCSANAYTISPESPLSAPEGDPALNLDMENEYSPPVTSLTDSTTTSDPTSNIAFEDGGSCAIAGNQPYYKEYIVNVSQSGTYTIGVPSRDGAVLMNYYSPSFNPNSVCMNWVGSNGTLLSGGGISLSYPFDQMLNANQNYILTVNGFFTDATRNYTLSFSGPGDYHLGYIPIIGFSYTYAIVDDGSGDITDFDPNSDLTNEAPGNYTVYGIHYDDNISLSTYVGGAFSTFQNDILSGTICASISSNSRSVEIETVLPVDFISFRAWKNGNHAELQWEISNAYNVSHFAVQRWDEQRQEFHSIGRIEWSKEKTIYQYTDRHATSGRNLYRIESVDIDGSTDHTQIRAVHFGEPLDYTVYPSPADAMIYWQGPRENTESIRIYNTDGKLVYEQMNPQNQRIQTTNWPEGLYFVEFNTEATIVRKKLLVAH